MKSIFSYCILILLFSFHYVVANTAFDIIGNDTDGFITKMDLVNISQSSTSAAPADGSTTATSSLEEVDYLLPKIDLRHWKVTLPLANKKGKPIEISPPEMEHFATIDVAKPYMYIDSLQGAIVFHAMPTNSTTRNTKYSRSELREQMVPGENNVNWTFAQGGRMRGVLSVPEISVDANGKPHKVIVMQIHGRLTNEQRDLIGEDDNNAPPILKIYWDKGRVRIKTKVVKDLNASYEELLHEKAWGDDEGYTIPLDVGHDKFSLEVIVSQGKMEIVFNDLYSIEYNSIHMQKWGIFENYFKAGNYFQSRDEGAFARVNYYELEVSHD